MYKVLTKPRCVYTFEETRALGSYAAKITEYLMEKERKSNRRGVGCDVKLA
jgi:hypothetical protein